MANTKKSVGGSSLTITDNKTTLSCYPKLQKQQKNTPPFKYYCPKNRLKNIF